MSNAATAPFLAAWRSKQRRPAALVVIELATPSAVTLRAATDELIADTYSFEAGFAHQPISDEVDYLDPGPAPVVAQFSLAQRDYAALAPHSLGASLSHWQWKGARIRIYRWERTLTSFADALQVFVGRVDTVSPGIGRTEFTAIQDRGPLTKRVASVVVDKSSRPDAPDGALGQTVPVIMGNLTTPLLRGPLAGNSLEFSFETAGGGRGVVPYITTDPGTGAAQVRVEAAANQLADIFNTGGTCRLFLAADGYLATVATSSSTITETLGSGGSYVDIDDDALVVTYRILPIDVRTGGGNNTALNPRRAMDVNDETNYATLNQTAGQNKLELLLPNPSPQGTIVGPVNTFVIFSGDAANTQNLRVYTRDNLGATGTLSSTASTSATPSIYLGTHDATWRSAGWEFGIDDGGMSYGGHVAGNTISLCVDFAGAVANNKARIYAVGIFIAAKPTQDLVTQGVQVLRQRQHTRFAPAWRPWEIVTTREGVPDVNALNASFFGLPKGQADDGGGTYTGTGAAVIERAPDMVRYLLAAYGGVSDLVTATNTFGSFVDCRSKLRNGEPSDIVLAAYITDKMTVQESCKKICEQSLAHFWQDVFDGYWRMVAWKRGDAVDYDLKLEWDHLGTGITASEGSIVDVQQEVRVSYLFDYFKGKTLAEAFVSDAGSSQGWQFPTVRDQVLTVDATNDKLDWKTGAWGGGPFTFGDTLAHATYAPIDLAVEVQGKLRTHIVPGYYTYAGHGFTIKTGYNDALEFGYGAGTYTATIPEGRYYADQLAFIVGRLMSAAVGLPGVIVGAYDHAANKFVLASSGSNINTIGPTTAASPGTLAWPVMGWVVGTAAAATLTAPAATYHERFWMRAESTATFQLMFATGAGVAATCATVLGWPLADTSVAASQAASYSRNDRETRAEALRTAHDVTGEAVMTADWIRDETSAVSLRNRRWDHVAEPPHRIVFDTYFMPDLRRMQTFEASSDIDTHVPFPRYGSDGSWSNKVLRCIGRRSFGGPSFHDEIVAVEA